MIADRFFVEARGNAGLNLMCEIGEDDVVALKQITAEILLCWRINKPEQNPEK